ncbi:hypothetical protein BOO69_07330 [Sulfitobacter alexandrii]|uniref:Tyr recombinase domain-containing protein n=1 Tax=Sulfitobacter alexandrii TaxID=1917485 RepID=A0A1J0WG08_9RHOB|nr:tyrosine-type recombinase/integrase [Sulfitobacter alexandrii]APE43249.1 hypothetical protein BOO69_07330 [Sulfitobacter alexandrii]
MQDVWDYFACQAPDPAKAKKDVPEGWRLQYLTKLKSHCGGGPLAMIFAHGDMLAEFDGAFPKVRKGVHPRPDLPQNLETYKKWRRQCRKAIEIATGAASEKAELRARQDGWADLLVAIKLHTTDGGIVHHAAASPVVTLADVGRRAGVLPHELAEEGILDRLEASFGTAHDLKAARKAQSFLRDFACIPEIGAVLPNSPVEVFPIRRSHAAIPAHIEIYLAQLVKRAGGAKDEVSGGDSDDVGPTTKQRWFAALRHHIRTLPHCPEERDLGYTKPISNLETIDDLAGLFAREHLYATLRRTKEMEHLPGHICHASAYQYYTDILRILWSNNPETDDFGEQIEQDAPQLIDARTHRAIKNCRIMTQGRELANGMTKKNQEWCQALVQDKAKRVRFRRLHLKMMAMAEAIFDAAAAEGRTLTATEINRVRQLGTSAAACAIEVAGRPIRLGNVLGLRLYGSRQNLSTKDPNYSFTLYADETKSGKDEPKTPLVAALGGPKVMAWYLKKIRPLFPHHETNIYLFPAIMTAGKRLCDKTFDAWFQRAASAADLPMTFHQWRHGYASLLLSANWNNLPLAAEMLGNTPGVCAKNYAWIDKERLILKGQAETLAGLEADL